MEIYQYHTNGGESILVDLKYGDRDISESSLVYPRSKDGGAGCRTTTFIIHKTKTLNYNLNVKFKQIEKEKCSTVVEER